jgi:hypothetical protein
MSDYEGFEDVDAGAESELGNYEAVQEVSGYDAVTTTQQGLQQDEFLKDSGLSIDTVGDAKKAEAKKDKKGKHSELADAFENARQHIDDHKYQMNIGGKDIEISHGDLKKAVTKEHQRLAKKMKGEKDVAKQAQIAQQMQMMQSIMAEMAEGKLSDESKRALEGHLKDHPEMLAERDIVNSDVVPTEVAVDFQQEGSLLNVSVLESYVMPERQAMEQIQNQNLQADNVVAPTSIVNDFNLADGFSDSVDDIDITEINNRLASQSNTHIDQSDTQSYNQSLQASNVKAPTSISNDFI